MTPLLSTVLYAVKASASLQTLAREGMATHQFEAVDNTCQSHCHLAFDLEEGFVCPSLALWSEDGNWNNLLI